MKIVVKSTKTISFDENSEDDDSSDHNEESEAEPDQNSDKSSNSGIMQPEEATIPKTEFRKVSKTSYPSSTTLAPKDDHPIAKQVSNSKSTKTASGQSVPSSQ